MKATFYLLIILFFIPYFSSDPQFTAYEAPTNDIHVTTLKTTTPVPILSNVSLSTNDNSLTILFNLTNANGTFYVGIEETIYGLGSLNLSYIDFNYPSWNLFMQGLNYTSNALAQFKNVSASEGNIASITLTNLTRNKTYLIYYGANNDDVSPSHTKLGVKVTTIATANGSKGAFGIFGILIGTMVMFFFSEVESQFL